jgi:hypothetical protein
MAVSFYPCLLSVAHGGTSFPKPIEFSIDETVDWATSDAGCVDTDEALCIKKNVVEAEVSCEDPIQPIAKGTSATLTATVQADDGTTGTVVCLTMLAGAAGFRAGGGGNARLRQRFRYKGASSDPITVTA